MDPSPDLGRLLESLFELERAAGRLEDDVRVLQRSRSDVGNRLKRPRYPDGERATELAGWTDRVEGLAAGLADACADGVEQLLSDTLEEGLVVQGAGALLHRRLDLATTLALTARRSAEVVRRAGQVRSTLEQLHDQLETRPLLDASDATERARDALDRLSSLSVPEIPSPHAGI